MTHLPNSTRWGLASSLVAAATVAALLPGSPVAPATAAAPTIARTGDGGEPPESGADVGLVPSIEWRTCEEDKRLQCATYAVPLDYRHPEAGTVRLAVNRLPAKGPGRIGSLFLNPGGLGRVGGGLRGGRGRGNRDEGPTPALRPRGVRPSRHEPEHS